MRTRNDWCSLYVTEYIHKDFGSLCGLPYRKKWIFSPVPQVWVWTQIKTRNVNADFWGSHSGSSHLEDYVNSIFRIVYPESCHLVKLILVNDSMNILYYVACDRVQETMIVVNIMIYVETYRNFRILYDLLRNELYTLPSNQNRCFSSSKS